MKRAIWIVAALVLLLTSVAPPATWATPTRDVYDVPNPENSGMTIAPSFNAAKKAIKVSGRFGM